MDDVRCGHNGPLRRDRRIAFAGPSRSRPSAHQPSAPPHVRHGRNRVAPDLRDVEATGIRRPKRLARAPRLRSAERDAPLSPTRRAHAGGGRLLVSGTRRRGRTVKPWPLSVDKMDMCHDDAAGIILRWSARPSGRGGRWAGIQGR
jgi:hypothetical protein